MTRFLARTAYLFPLVSGGAAKFSGIEVYGNGILIADGDSTPSTGDHTNFGQTTKLVTVSKVYTIKNTGEADLIVSSIVIPSGYTLTDPLSFPLIIAPGVSDTFTVRFDATTPAAYSGDIVVNNNSPDIAAYNFAITATAAYAPRVLALNPIQYLKLDEASGSAASDASGNGRNGAYSNVTLAAYTPPMLGNAPSFDGLLSYVNTYSASLAGALSFDEFTLMIWFKVNAILTDGLRHTMAMVTRDVNTQIWVRKEVSNNRLRFSRVAGGGTKVVTLDGFSNTGDVCLTFSGSIVGGGLLGAGELKAYLNGVQVGTTQTGLAAAAGSGLSSILNNIGASSQVPTESWKGNLYHYAYFNQPVSNALLALATI